LACSEGVLPSELLEREQRLDGIIDNNDVVVDFLEDVHVSVTSLKSHADANKVGGENNYDGSDSVFFRATPSLASTVSPKGPLLSRLWLIDYIKREWGSKKNV
jgi:hypothetical protein